MINKLKAYLKDKNAAALIRISTSNIPEGYEKIVLYSDSRNLAGNYIIKFNNSKIIRHWLRWKIWFKL